MNRTATALLWGGLALILLSVLSCGAGCALALDSALGNSGEEDTVTACTTAGGWMFLIGMIAAISGAILKAIRKFRPEISVEPETIQEHSGVFCTDCGIFNDATANFCKRCGSSLSGRNTNSP